MKILLCRWGILTFKPILDFYVEFSYIVKAINNENIIVSLWLFKNLPKMFKNSYVLYSPSGIGDRHKVLKLIKKLEEKEGFQLSDEKKNEILELAEDVHSTIDNDEPHTEIRLITLKP